ncbi:MAG: hypothetical protein ACRYGR_01885 [Janthinobacterium lividum]
MASGYKLSADIAVEQANTGPRERAVLVYPIIFAYRHYIELALKAGIATFGRYAGVKSDWKNHRLESLWIKFAAIQKEITGIEPDEADAVVEGVVLEFAKVDPDSFAYRYPCDKNGKLLPVEHSELNLAGLKAVMDRVENYFGGCESAMGAVVENFPDADDWP